MNSSEEEFLRQLKETFEIEAKEHLHEISTALLAMEKGGEKQTPPEGIDSLFREAHSLKGAARAVNHTLIQDICQSLESVLSSVKKGEITLSPSSFDILHTALDLIGDKLTADEPSEGDLEEIDKLTNALNAIAEGNEVEERSEEDKEESGAESDENIPVRDAPVEIEPPPSPIPPPSAAAREEPPTSPPKKEEEQKNKREPEQKKKEKHQEPSPTSSQTIRVSTSKLDKLLQQIEELLTLKLTSRQRVLSLEEIHKEFEKWEVGRRRIQKDIQMLRQLAIKQNGDEKKDYTNLFSSLLNFFNWQEEHLKKIEDRVTHLGKETEQDYRISGSIIDNLLEEAKEVLMQPCQTLFDIFPRMIRDISRSVKKEVELTINGADIEIDRRILEEIKDPLIHLIRNSIDHGIETPEERLQSGKNKKGTLSITVSQASGSNVDIILSDDGKGVSIDKLIKAALKNGTIHQKDAEDMSDREALMLMFQSGVTTSEIITDISGRGVGMGVVSEKVEKLGGSIDVVTNKGKGTEFHIRLPLTLATFRGVHLLVEGQGFIIPTHYLQRVVRIHKKDIKTIEGKETISYNGKNISFVKLRDLLGIENSQKKEVDNPLFYVLIVKASETTLALSVDKILNEQEVFIKGLGKQLKRVRNIADATVMEWGKVIPILDPFDIVKSVTRGVQNIPATVKSTTKQKEAPKKNILIAEDTVTARMLLKNILDSSGYNVKTAVDGQEAFSILVQEEIDLLLSDIEMPRMTGFELAEKVRGTEKLKDLPIVLCSSLCTKEDKERGVAVGANAYIVKSSFEQSNLLETIQKLI